MMANDRMNFEWPEVTEYLVPVRHEAIDRGYIWPWIWEVAIPEPMVKDVPRESSA